MTHTFVLHLPNFVELTRMYKVVYMLNWHTTPQVTHELDVEKAHRLPRHTLMC